MSQELLIAPTDAFGVSLNVITTDCNHKTFRRIDMGTEESSQVVDFRYVTNLIKENKE